MQDLILVRHGESEYSARGLLNGDPRVAVSLTDEGREQARRLGGALADVDVDLCVTSEFARTIETADVAFAGRVIPRLVVPELDDHPAGDYEGRLLSDYLDWAHNATPSDFIPGTSESRATVLGRFARGYARVYARPERTIVAILHSLPILYLLEAAAGNDPVARLGLLPYADPRKLDHAQVEQALARLERWLKRPAWGEPAE
jgi:2,3-bisphosphoglycerate-dependent phosphoglycerate mutase